MNGRVFYNNELRRSRALVMEQGKDDQYRLDEGSPCY
jgi:hypothetical protein